MSLLLLPKFDILKPPMGRQINLGHPLSNGLGFACLCNEGGARTFDLITQMSGVLSSAAFVQTDWQGSAINFSGSGSVVFGTEGANRYASLANFPMSGFVVSNLATHSGSGDPTLIGVSGWRGWLFDYEHWNNSNNTLELSIQGVGYIISTTGVPTGKKYLGFSATASAVTFCTNGVLETVAHSLVMASPADTVTIGAGYLSDVLAIGGLNGTIAAAYIWNRALTSEELLALTQDPYCFFQPQSPQRRYWSTVGAAVETMGYLEKNNLHPRLFRPGNAR